MGGFIVAFHLGESDSDMEADDGDVSDNVSDMDHDEDLVEQGVDEMFRSEVRQALGNAALLAGESDNEVELDDEAMMKLDPMLSDIFKKKKVNNDK